MCVTLLLSPQKSSLERRPLTSPPSKSLLYREDLQPLGAFPHGASLPYREDFWREGGHEECQNYLHTF